MRFELCLRLYAALASALGNAKTNEETTQQNDTKRRERAGAHSPPAGIRQPRVWDVRPGQSSSCGAAKDQAELLLAQRGSAVARTS